jgi:hypothetical protein
MLCFKLQSKVEVMWLIHNTTPDETNCLDVKFFADREDAEREAKELGWVLHPAEVELEDIRETGK